MKAFITGSRAYGFPKPDSDTDLVVLVSSADLLKLSEAANEEIDLEYGIGGSRCFRFGNLNLLAVDNEVDFNVWLEGTQELTRQRPVTRDQAIAVFRRRRKEAGRLPNEEDQA